jgi:rsbT co-antagonist protein RsbR
MHIPANAPEGQAQLRRFRQTLWCGIAIMLGFLSISMADYLSSPTLPYLSTACTDGTFLLSLLTLQALQARMRLDRRAAVLVCVTLAYAVMNVLLFPDLILRFMLLPIVAVLLAVAYIDSLTLRRLSVAAWLTMLLLIGLSGRTQAGLPAFDRFLNVDLLAACATTGIGLLVLNQFHARMTELLDESQHANGALQVAQSSLAAQVAEQTASLQQALHDLQVRSSEQAQLLAEVEMQRTTIRDLSVPLLPIGDQMLVVPLVGVFDLARLTILKQQTLAALEGSRITHLVFDITGVPVVDAEIAAELVTIVQAARLLGTQVVLAGIRPEVAQTIVSLGIDLGNLRTVASLRDAVALRTAN